jgi:hypothetical protein
VAAEFEKCLSWLSDIEDANYVAVGREGGEKMGVVG